MKTLFRSGVFMVFFSLTSLMLNAQTLEDEKEKEFKDWNFRLGPYLWLLNIEGELIKPPQPSTLPEVEPSYQWEIPFPEVISALKFAFLFSGEYNADKWTTSANISSFILAGDAITPKEILFHNAQYQFSFASGEILGGYRAVRRPKFNLDVSGGFKFIYSKIHGETDVLNSFHIEGNRDVLWIEPIVALHFKYIPHYRLEFSAYADYGPIRSEEELSNQYLISSNILISKWFYLSPGYRYWFFAKSYDEAVFNGQIYGWHIKFGAQF